MLLTSYFYYTTYKILILSLTGWIFAIGVPFLKNNSFDFMLRKLNQHFYQYTIQLILS